MEKILEYQKTALKILAGKLGGFYLAPGYSTEYMYVYLATDLRYDPLEADADELHLFRKA